jgi:universal stress protein A
MFTNQSILVPTDFSPASALALDAAALLAKQFSARVTLLHVFDATPFTLYGGPIGAPGVSGVGPDIEARIHGELTRARDEHFAGLNAETALVLSTSPSEAICELAKKIGADMIVIATHGRTGLTHLLIGSVAERVVRHAPCPVLTLRSKA